MPGGLDGIGTRDRRITIRQAAQARSTTGQPTDTWSDLVSVWANVRPAKGQERTDADVRQAWGVSEFRIDWRDDVTHAMRILDENDQLFDILSIDMIGRRQGLLITAEVKRS